jgi:ABC-type sugar transport system ATPase subunit
VAVAAIELASVGMWHPGAAAPALADLSLSVAAGERLAIVGPSGSGKSTVLRLVAGLDRPTTGRVRIDGVDVTDVAPEARDLAMVFQSYALYPHMSVRENLAFPLRMRGLGRAEIEARLAPVAAALGLAALLDRRPAALSGGERQRVALGRAIVRRPRAFLLDEPLSNLDPRRRAGARAELVALHARLAATMIYVTHDQEEAMTLGQRVAVLQAGRLEQVAADLVEPLGHATIVHVTADGGTRLTAMAPGNAPWRAGDAVSLVVAGARLHRFAADGRRVDT